MQASPALYAFCQEDVLLESLCYTVLPAFKGAVGAVDRDPLRHLYQRQRLERFLVRHGLSMRHLIVTPVDQWILDGESYPDLGDVNELPYWVRHVTDVQSLRWVCIFDLSRFPTDFVLLIV